MSLRNGNITEFEWILICWKRVAGLGGVRNTVTVSHDRDFERGDPDRDFFAPCKHQFRAIVSDALADEMLFNGAAVRH